MISKPRSGPMGPVRETVLAPVPPGRPIRSKSQGDPQGHLVGAGKVPRGPQNRKKRETD